MVNMPFPKTLAMILPRHPGLKKTLNVRTKSLDRVSQNRLR